VPVCGETSSWALPAGRDSDSQEACRDRFREIDALGLVRRAPRRTSAGKIWRVPVGGAHADDHSGAAKGEMGGEQRGASRGTVVSRRNLGSRARTAKCQKLPHPQCAMADGQRPDDAPVRPAAIADGKGP